MESNTEPSFYDELAEAIHQCEENEKLIQELSKPDWSLAPVWFMTCVLAYLYGVTLGVYMCSK